MSNVDLFPSHVTPRQDAQCLSLCGPDASKLGTDFSVSLSVCSEPSSGFSAFCPPQVLAGAKCVPFERTSHCLGPSVSISAPYHVQ